MRLRHDGRRVRQDAGRNSLAACDAPVVRVCGSWSGRIVARTAGDRRIRLRSAAVSRGFLPMHPSDADFFVDDADFREPQFEQALRW